MDASRFDFGCDQVYFFNITHNLFDLILGSLTRCRVPTNVL
jgi:hypothetical protein